MLKTYSGDLDYVRRLMNSFHTFNADSLTLYLVVPRRDRTLFDDFRSETTRVVCDEDIPVSYASVEEASVEAIGILNAGVSKLGFWKLELCENYFAIDSDMVFIRPFGRSDFIGDNGVPYLAVTESLNQRIDPFYFQRYWKHREEALVTVAATFGKPNAKLASIHNSQVLNSQILRHLDVFMVSSEIRGYKDLMSRALYEFFWYGFWALTQSEVQVVQREELVRMIHHQGEHLALWNLGIRQEDLARGYLGVIVNSNWSRQYGILDYEHPPAEKYRQIGKWAEWLRGSSKIEDATS